MKNLMYSLALLLASPLLVGQSSVASTLDGSTPAMETICDLPGIVGKAKGLCNAYCEAQDCDLLSNDPAASPSNRELTSCAKIGARYADAATDLGISPTLPCEVPPLPDCPCEQLPGWSVAYSVPHVDSNQQDSQCPQPAEAIYRESFVGPAGTIQAGLYFMATGPVSNDSHWCAIAVLDTFNFYEGLSAEEHASCYAQVQARQEAQGVTVCPDFP